MKKIFLTTIMALSLVTSAFAVEKNKVNVLIKNSFNSEFRYAKEVQWTSGDEFVTASFILESIRMNAFYDYKGNLIGTSHAVSLDNLPARSKRAFAKKYSDFTVKEAILFERGDETAYYLSASKAGKTIVLKVMDGHVSVVR